MDNFIELLKPFSVSMPSGMVVIVVIFSLAIAIFHTIIFSHLFNINPRWSFFVLNPAVIIATALVNTNYTSLALFLVAISVFIFAFIGMIYVSIIGHRQSKKSRQRFNKKHNIAPTPLWKNVLRFFASVAFIILFFTSGAYAFVVIFLVITIEKLLPSTKNEFIKLQSTLPTSRIRSVSMGLAEITGKLIMITPVISPIKKRKCIGYRYTIDDVSTDKDGKKSYSNILTKTDVKPFYVKDDTGQIKVIPEGKLEFVWIAVSDRYVSHGKRYSQYLLKQDDEVLLIGKASLKNNEPIFTHESIKNILAISPLEKVRHYNTFKPLLNAFIVFTALFALIVALILITPMEIKNNQIRIETPVFKHY